MSLISLKFTIAGVTKTGETIFSSKGKKKKNNGQKDKLSSRKSSGTIDMLASFSLISSNTG